MTSPIINGAVLGSPVSHSLSPLLHRSIFKHLGLALAYEAIDVQSGSLSSFLDENIGRFDYLSLTMPLKEEALYLTVKVDSLVQRIQSANTLINRSGELSLYSTDGLGLIKSLEAKGKKSFDSVLVLGAGGTARAVVGALDSIASKVSVLGRTSTRSALLESAILHSEFSYLRWSDTPDLSPYDLIVNTTPAGAADVLAASLSSGLLQRVSAERSPLLFDVIYNPWPTVLASRWNDLGGEVVNGSEMLLYQGIAQAELVLGRPLDYEELAKAVRPILISALK